MDVREYIKIRKCHHSLTTRMDVKAPLLSCLYQDGVINDDNKDFLETKATNAAKASELLRLMQMTDCKKRSPYPSLLNALTKCDQEFLSEELENCIISTEDILLYKDDLRPFLKRGETIKSLLEEHEEKADGCPPEGSGPGARRSLPPPSSESLKSFVKRRVASDIGVRYYDNNITASSREGYETPLQCKEHGSGSSERAVVYEYTRTITPLDSGNASQSRMYVNYPRKGEDIAKEVVAGPVFTKRDCDKFPERKTTMNCPKINKVSWRPKSTWKTKLTALDSTSCVKGNGDIIVYGQTAQEENRISVHKMDGPNILAWTPISQSVDGLNTLVFHNRVRKQHILAVVSSEQEKQIDLYDVNTGKFIRCCSYKELDPGIMCTGPKGQIVVVDRSTDPWSIAVLDTDKDDLPVVKKFMSGVRHIWGIRFAETPDGKIIFASSYLARCLIAIDWKSGDTLWKISTPTWSPYNICKSVKGCLFVTNIEKQCQEIFVYDYRGNHITTLTRPGLTGILDLHCLSNETDTFLVLGHLENTQRTMSVFKLDIK